MIPPHHYGVEDVLHRTNIHQSHCLKNLLAQWFANWRVQQNHLDGLLKPTHLGPALGESDSVGPGWSLRSCISRGSQAALTLVLLVVCASGTEARL